jgi:hypothetical protein
MAYLTHGGSDALVTHHRVVTPQGGPGHGGRSSSIRFHSARESTNTKTKTKTTLWPSRRGDILR